MKLTLLPENFAVCQLDSESALPAWLNYTGHSFVARTPDELSIVCPEDMSAPHAKVEKGWRCLRLDAPETAMREKRVEVAGALARAGLRTLAFSTFSTEYLLLREVDFLRAEKLLVATGYRFEGED